MLRGEADKRLIQWINRPPNAASGSQPCVSFRATEGRPGRHWLDSSASFRLSQTLGLKGWPLWRWLLLPRMAPQIGFAAGLTGALSVGDLGVIALFADLERATLPLQMYRLMGAYRMEAAGGAALLLLAMALAIFWLCDRGGRHLAEA